MTAPDPAYVRMYRNTMDRHLKGALDEARSIAQSAGWLIKSIEEGQPRTWEADRIAQMAPRLAQRIAALEALKEVEYFTTDPEAGES